MSRKDYQLIASVLQQSLEYQAVYTTKSSQVRMDEIETIAYRFVRVLREDNPRFDTDKFLEAAIGAPVAVRQS